DAAGVYVANEAELRERSTRRETVTEPAPEPVTATAKTAAAAPRTHTVRSGESLGVIARRYGVGVSELKRWNGLRSDMIRAGQKRVVANAPSPSPAPASGEPRYIYHVVQPGDTLPDVAKRYPGTSVEDIKRLNGDLDDEPAPGERIKVAVEK